jgi:glycosyltransferase involved in cell wall biosynthesis
MPGRVLEVLEATIGGTKRHLLELSAGLRNLGWDVEVACPRVRSESHGDVSFWDDLRAAGIPTHAVAMRRETLSPTNAVATIRLAQLVRAGDYAIVHAHSSVAGALARPAARLAGTPRALHNQKAKTVYTPHGYAFLNPGSTIRRRLYLEIERTLGRITNRLIALSPTEAEATLSNRIVTPERLATIPLGVNPADFPSPERVAEVRAREGWGSVPVVGTISRMTAQKDPFTWLRTARRVADAHPDVRFIWIWSGELEAEVRALASSLGLDGIISFLGHRPDARELIAACDLFLLTSAFEGLPYSVIEALTSGTPVVATDVVGTRDLIRRDLTGLLAPARDDAALAACVVRLLDDPDLARRLATAGRDDVLGRFSVERMVEQTASLYDSLLH